MVALFVVLTIVAFLLLDGVVLLVQRHKAARTAEVMAPAHPLTELLPQPAVPGGVFLSPAHLWVSLLPAGQARIGFDPLVRTLLGTPDRVDAPASGTHVGRGDPLFSARWADRSVLFRSPVEGTVQAARSGLEPTEPDDWILTIQPEHARRDLGILPMAEDARDWFAQEWGRVRDFVAAHSLRTEPALVLADGGRPVMGWMKQEPDETWDRFVASFLSPRNGDQSA